MLSSLGDLRCSNSLGPEQSRLSGINGFMQSERHLLVLAIFRCTDICRLIRHDNLCLLVLGLFEASSRLVSD